MASHFVPTYGGRVEIGLPCKTSQGVHSNIKDFKGGPKEVQYTLRNTIEHLIKEFEHALKTKANR